jgi:MFS transporter, PPP family, 3-phenylpropionic acid transporter
MYPGGIVAVIYWSTQQVAKVMATTYTQWSELSGCDSLFSPGLPRRHPEIRMPTQSVQPSTRSALYRIAALQFLTYAARGLVYPFVNLYLISVGFSGTQIGLLASVSALVQLGLTPILHTWADRASSHRRLYYGLLCGSASAPLGLVVSANPLWLGGMVLLRDASDVPAAALLSQLTITWLQQRQRPIYGQLRAWGSFGWAVTTMISGRIFAVGGYGLLFMLASLTMLALLPLARVLPPRTAEPHQQSGPAPRRPRGFYILLGGVFLYFVGGTAFNAFANIYFKQDLGATNETIGMLSSLAALGEIPAMVLIDRLLRRADIRVTMIAGMLGMSMLWFAFSQLTGTALLIPLMTTRGTFFTLQMISVTLLVSRISHPANAATNQALAQVTVPGLAVLLTGSLSGWLFDQIGARVLFQLSAVMAVLASIVLVIARAHLVEWNTESG